MQRGERSDRLNEESAMEPPSQITAYLFAHKSTLEFSTIDQVVKDVKLSVFYSMPPISDDEIRKIVVQWATFNAVGLLLSEPMVSPLSPPAPGASPAEFESALSGERGSHLWESRRQHQHWGHGGNKEF
jgi:hypothetical protein